VDVGGVGEEGDGDQVAGSRGDEGVVQEPVSFADRLPRPPIASDGRILRSPAFEAKEGVPVPQGFKVFP